MKITDTVTAQRFGVDEAYQRFFDGFSDLGKPADVLASTMVLSPIRWEPVTPRRRPRARRMVKAGRIAKR
jgi:hypothetical protein